MKRTWIAVAGLLLALCPAVDAAEGMHAWMNAGDLDGDGITDLAEVWGVSSAVPPVIPPTAHLVVRGSRTGRTLFERTYPTPWVRFFPARVGPAARNGLFVEVVDGPADSVKTSTFTAIDGTGTDVWSRRYVWANENGATALWPILTGVANVLPGKADDVLVSQDVGTEEAWLVQPMALDGADGSEHPLGERFTGTGGARGLVPMSAGDRTCC